MMKVVYVGNFGPAHSTESHVAQALEAIGVEVVREQEQKVDWSTLAERCRGATFFLWTSTHDYSPPSLYPAQRQFLADCPVPTVGYHLDIWWSLSREHRVREAPFFQVGLLVTADGGHDDRWVDAGINHRWMPPAVSEFECEPGVERGEFCSPVAFVGSWDGGYHAEHQHREQLVRWLQKRRPDCQFWPKPRQHAVRGEALRDLYASVGVVVGDSCFAGQIVNYHSDRIPETVGRGGFLLHPAVEGVTDGTLYTDGEHLRTWRVGDWEALHYLIDHYLAHPDEARQIARQGRRHVLEHHTYTVRMRQLVDLLRTEGLIAKPPGRSRKTPVAA
jgi:hypothetical protein